MSRIIPTLPEEIEGHSIKWERWDLAPWMTHIDNGCDICDHEGPLSVAFGRSRNPIQVFHASRCRRCQTTRVITRTAEFGSQYEYVWEHVGTEVSTNA